MSMLSWVLFIANQVLLLVGVTASLIFIWLNVFSRITDKEHRNEEVLKTIRLVPVFSLILPLIFCLSSSNSAIETVMKTTALQYLIDTIA